MLRLVRGLEFRRQRPEAVEDLTNPEIVAVHQARQVDPFIPALQQALKLHQLVALRLRWLPSQGVPERRFRRGGGHGCSNNSS